MTLLGFGVILAAALTMLLDTRRVARPESSKGVAASSEHTPVEDSGRATHARRATNASSGNLFNKKDLAGWKHQGGGKASIRDGRLVLENDPQRRTGYLVSDLKARDFEVRIRCKMVRGDSGFCFRCRPHDRTPIEIVGLQVQLNVEPDRGLGGLFEMHGRGWLAKPTPEANARRIQQIDWLDCRIVAAGPRIQVWINGAKTADHEDSQAAETEGFFALQIHGGGFCEVLFEEIIVKVIR